MCSPAPIAGSAPGSATPRSAGPSSRRSPKALAARPRHCGAAVGRRCSEGCRAPLPQLRDNMQREAESRPCDPPQGHADQIVSRPRLANPLAQAFRRLGSEVHLVSTAENLMPGDAPEAGELIRRRFEHEELRIHLGFKAVRAGGGRLTVQGPAGARELPYDALLLGTGRKPNVEQLGLEAAGVRFRSDGAEVDEYLRPSNPNIYAAGDRAFPQKINHT